MSDIRLPVQQEVLLQFETEILGEKIRMFGSVVWMEEINPDVFQYGLEFNIDENERTDLTRILNRLSILLRKNPMVPDCSFIDVNRYTFFKHKV